MYARGTPAFSDIVTDPPTSELEFIAIWKFYVLSLIASVLEDYDITSGESQEVRIALAAAGLASDPGGLRGLVRRVRDYVSRLLNAEALEGGLILDPATGLPAGVSGKIVLGEPSAAMRDAGLVSVDDLLDKADHALAGVGVSLWVLSTVLTLLSRIAGSLRPTRSALYSGSTSIRSG